MSIADDIERIALQEKELRIPSLDMQFAWDLGSRLRALAIERGHVLVIEVRRFNQQLFYAALEGTTPDNAEWVRRKSNVVARFHRSSYAVCLHLQSKGTTLQDTQGLPVADFAPHGGSFPLHVAGSGVVGCVTVSGLPQRADHEFVVEGLSAHLGRDYNSLKLGTEDRVARAIATAVKRALP